MSALAAFRDGWRAMRMPRRWQLVFVFFALYLLVAAATGAPLYSLLGKSPGSNLFGREMMRGFDYQWATDFLHWNRGVLEFFSRAIVWAAILFALLQTALWAGALEVLRHGAQPPTWVAFFGKGCARNFGPFLRMALIGVLLYYLAFLLLDQLAARLVDDVTRDLLPEWPGVVLHWICVALLIFVMLAINLVLDYARIRIVLEDRTSAVLSLFASLSLLRGRVLTAAGAYVLWGIAGLALAAAYLGLASAMPQSNGVGIAVWFCLAQLFLFLRLWIRMGFYTSALAITAAAAPPEIPGPPTLIPMHFE